MTRTIGIADRVAWFVVTGAVMTLALAVGVGLLTDRTRLRTAQTPAPSVTAATGWRAPLDPRIAATAAAQPAQPVEAIVQFRNGVRLADARRDVARVGGRVFGELHIINALAIRLPAERARWLAASPDVHAVSLNAAITPQNGALGGSRQANGHRGSLTARSLQATYDQTLGATGLWRSGIDGAGVGVAVVDTGVDGNLPDFQSPNGRGSRVVEAVAVNPAARTATDSYGHGTDVAGIIAGDGDNLSPADPLRGQYIGVAPLANLISIKVADQNGNATVLDVIYGLQFAVDHRSEDNIRVVNLSLDATTPQSYTTDPLDAAAEAAWNHGIVVVAAAGNRGTDPDAVQYAPANDPFVITVGAVDENGTATPGDDTIPGWSSVGTTQDGFHKPDVYGPGAHIVSVLAPNSTFGATCGSCTIGGEYIRTSGTSMAAAAISGLAADVLQAHPGWTPDQLKGALTTGGVSSSSSIQEASGASVVALSNPPRADQGLRPNDLINAATGGVDYGRSSWSRSSWSAAWTRSSWSTYFDHSTSAR